MTKIEHFQQVSTTYCNIDNKKFVEEILYPASVDWREAVSVAENADSNTLDLLAQHYITDFPNTYTFTKRLAEHCVNDLLVGKVPTVICRPSVVIGSLEEPFEGWSDNFNGPVGLLIAGASGLLRIVYADSEIDTDYNAVDNVVKGMIVSAWHNATATGNLQEIFIYQMCKGDKLPYKLGNLIEHGKKLYWDIPLERKVWFPRNKPTKCWYEYFVTVLLCQVIPAMFFDLVLWIAGYPPTIFKIQRKIYIANMAISHFMLNDWKFDNRKYDELFEIVPIEERSDFNFTVRPSSEFLIYDFYMKCGNYVRYYLLKESKEVTQKNKTRTLWMFCADWVLRVVSYLGLAWIVLVKYCVPLTIFNAFSLYWINL
ncbi:unnamed protein product [Ceutorhynchus assimilis]|uniref:Fatty acyl-CoA reductase n=1 Tax=Ceutorhynchus assimilis TaxID=467358 RepID=A0A9N9MVP1_9CUCU|nr:unnamed protein product [Ceutorhynchus assimilis]